MKWALRCLALLALLTTATGIVWVLAISEWTKHPHNGGFGYLWLIFPLLFAIFVCPVPAIAAVVVALIAAARVRHRDAVAVFSALSVLTVGITIVLYLGVNNAVTNWVIQRISNGYNYDLLSDPRPFVALSALDLVIPLAVFAYTLAGERIRPAVMTICALLAATGTGLLLSGAG